MSKRLYIEVTLKEYLQEIEVTPYVLAKWVDGVSPQTIYAVANGSRRPSLDVLESILTALHSNGFPVKISDILSSNTEL